jgi:hypothetical protein
MEKPNIIKQEQEENKEWKIGESILSTPPQSKSEHEQAMAFVESHREMLEHYARGSIVIEPAPKGLNIFAFNLKKNTIYINSMFYKELGLSDERTLFASLHEIEHFLEKKQILAENGGIFKFKKYLDRIKKSRAFSLTDNCVADIHVNRSVISKSNEDMQDIEKGMYTEILFKEKDFTKAPRHIQFAQALLRESRVPDEKCIVSDEVRVKLDQIEKVKGKSGISLIDIMTSPNTSMSDRLALQDKFIMPIIEELKEKDIEEEKEKRKEKKEEKKKKDKKEKKEGEDEKDKEDEGEKGEENDDENEGEKGEENEEGDNGEGKDDEDGESGEGDDKKGTESGDGDLDEDFDPNELWKKEYDKADEMTPNAVSQEDIEKAVEEYEKAKKAEMKSEKEIQEELDEEYAKNIGVKKEDLQQYRKLVKDLEKIINPETNRNVIEELRELIAKIISKRKNKKLNPKYPVEEGEDLVEPAELVAEVRRGNLSPKVWETHELKEKQDNKFGEIEISLVCDRSGSMEGQKLIEQQKATVLMMEALKDFADICKKEKGNLNKPLEIRSEIYSFQSSDDDRKPIKVMSGDLSEIDRIKTASKLASCNGSTTDFVPLETIASSLEEKTKRKIKEGELKKIVIVFTDGESDDLGRVVGVLKNLRENGVVTIGIGITNSGSKTLITYAPDGRLAETAEKLPIILGDLLKEHLASV